MRIVKEPEKPPSSVYFILFYFPALFPRRATAQSHFVMQPVTGLKAGKMRKEGEIRVVTKIEEISQDPPLEALEDVNIRSPSG